MYIYEMLCQLLQYLKYINFTAVLQRSPNLEFHKNSISIYNNCSYHIYPWWLIGFCHVKSSKIKEKGTCPPNTFIKFNRTIHIWLL